MVCYFGGGILRGILGQLLPQDRFDYRTDRRSRGLWLPDPSDKFAIERVLHDVDRRCRQYVDNPAVVMVPTSLWRAGGFSTPTASRVRPSLSRCRLLGPHPQPRPPRPPR